MISCIGPDCSICVFCSCYRPATRHLGQYGAPLKEVERVTSVMLECSYKFGGEYGWRVSLSGAAVFDSAVGSGAQVPLLGDNRG